MDKGDMKQEVLDFLRDDYNGQRDAGIPYYGTWMKSLVRFVAIHPRLGRTVGKRLMFAAVRELKDEGLVKQVDGGGFTGTLLLTHSGVAEVAK